MSTTKPRPADVARWVAILTKPIPPHYGGAALAGVRREHKRARVMLSSWGLDPRGNPLRKVSP